MPKNFILDTNVILHDAESLFKFEEHQIFLPITILEEIDNKKKDMNEVGRNARQFSRYIDDLRSKGKLVDGVPVNNKGGVLKVVLFENQFKQLMPEEDYSKNDNKILATALYVKSISENESILVTKDTNLRIKADVYELNAEDYKNDKIQTDELYTGSGILYTSKEIIDKLYDQKEISVDEIEHGELYDNQFFTIFNINNSKHSALVQYNKTFNNFKVIYDENDMFGITPRNTEQEFAVELLRNPNISLVTILGKAGSGKTLLSVCAGLESVMELGIYKKMILAKPIVSMDNGHALGFLPGTLEEKLGPWLASFTDNIDYIMPDYNKEEPVVRKGKKAQEIAQEKKAGKTSPTMELYERGILEMGSLEHIRGRSLPFQYIIIDESQNLTPHAIKTIITRAGEGTKIILLGDVSQIDCPYLDSESNGLSYVIERFKGQKMYGHITLRKSERSLLAEVASELL